MMRLRIVAIFAAIFITAALFCSEVSALTASYKQITTGANLPGPQERIVKLKDKKVRMEMDTPEGKTIIIIDGSTMYSYSPSQDTAVKFTSEASLGTEVLSDYADYLKSLNAQVVGSERVGKYDCDIYEYTDPRMNAKSKVWLWKKNEFPVKVETKVPHGSITTVMEDIKLGIAIDDSEFMLPAGIKIMDTRGTMMQ